MTTQESTGSTMTGVLGRWTGKFARKSLDHLRLYTQDRRVNAEGLALVRSRSAIRSRLPLTSEMEREIRS